MKKVKMRKQYDGIAEFVIVAIGISVLVMSVICIGGCVKEETAIRAGIVGTPYADENNFVPKWRESHPMIDDESYEEYTARAKEFVLKLLKAKKDKHVRWAADKAKGLKHKAEIQKKNEAKKKADELLAAVDKHRVDWQATQAWEAEKGQLEGNKPTTVRTVRRPGERSPSKKTKRSTYFPTETFKVDRSVLKEW